MYILNTKIHFNIGKNHIITDELINEDFQITINSSQDYLKCFIKTTKTITNFCIEFYIKIDDSYRIFYANGYQTWSKVKRLVKSNKSTLKRKLKENILKNTGWDYTGEFDSKNDTNSYGLYYIENDNNDIQLFCSLSEDDAYTKYNFDFDSSILTISRNFQNKIIDRNLQLCDITRIKDKKQNAFKILQKRLNIDYQSNKRLVAYSTFDDLKSNISEDILNYKINHLPSNYNALIIGDGYCTTGYNPLVLDKKRLPYGFINIVKQIHQKNMLAGIWIAPFAISCNSKYLNNYQDCIVTRNNTPATTCPYWGGAYSLDIEHPKTINYLTDLFDKLINNYQFDIIYCDCIYMAGAIPTNGNSQASLITKAVNLLRKLTLGKTLILGGLPYLSAINKCDYISVASDCSGKWINTFDCLNEQMTLGAKSNIESVCNKMLLNKLHPCIYSIPPCKKISNATLKQIDKSFENIILPEMFL